MSGPTVQALVPEPFPCRLPGPAPAVAGLRILEFCDYYGPGGMGGSERVAREVNRRLAGLGADLVVATAVRGDPFDDEGVRTLPRPARDLSGVVGAQLSVSRGYLRWALQRAREWWPNVIYTHSLHFQGSLVAACLSRRLRVPLVTVVHVGNLEMLSGHARALSEAYERTVGRFILASSRQVVAVSEAAAEHSRTRGAAPETISVAPNGVDHARFFPVPTPGGTPTVAFVGRLIANKGPGLAIEAARRLWRRGARFRLVVVGDGPLRGDLERAAGDAGGEVRFVGHSSDVAGWLRLAHIVVRPSYTEGMPLTVLEAMAVGRCVVVSDIAPHREIVDHLYNGVVHRAGDASDLAAQLAVVITDRELRDRLADEARRSVERFTWEHTASGHGRALVQASGANRPAPTFNGPRSQR